MRPFFRPRSSFSYTGGRSGVEDLLPLAGNRCTLTDTHILLFQVYQESSEEDVQEASDQEISGGRYVVEKIVSRRLRWKVDDREPNDSDYEYLIKWECYGPEFNTWEPLESLDKCPKKLQEFMDKLKRKHRAWWGSF